MLVVPKQGPGLAAVPIWSTTSTPSTMEHLQERQEAGVARGHGRGVGGGGWGGA